MAHPTDYAVINHIATLAAYETARLSGTYSHETLATEGFIHFSTDLQYPKTLSRFFQGHKDLVLLKINTSALQSPLKYEYSEPNEPPFPHLYGTLNMDAVTEVYDLTEQSTGAWSTTARTL